MDQNNISRYPKGKRPQNCTCLTTPKLMQTGFSNPDWKCPVCDQLYGQEEEYNPYDEEEFFWPA